MTVSTVRPRWTDTLRDAADLALLGIAATLAALPVITAGAAVAAASAAAHDRCVAGDLPSWRTTARRFGCGLLPGAGAVAVSIVVAGLLLLDLRAVATGAVPGGGPLLAVTALVTLALLGLAGLIVVEVGRRGGAGWLASARAAARAATGRPALLAASAGVCAVAVLLGLFIPVTAPLAFGYALFALHVVAGGHVIRPTASRSRATSRRRRS